MKKLAIQKCKIGRPRIVDFYLLFCGDGLLYGGGERETELAGLFKGEERQEFFEFEKKTFLFIGHLHALLLRANSLNHNCDGTAQL